MKKLLKILIFFQVIFISCNKNEGCTDPIATNYSSDAEQNEFYNKSLGIERYIFNNLWPRTNGYANGVAVNGQRIDSSSPIVPEYGAGNLGKKSKYQRKISTFRHQKHS